jgi:hypothetical protein
VGGDLSHAGSQSKSGHVASQPLIAEGTTVGPNPQGGVGRAGDRAEIAGQSQDSQVGEVNDPVFAAFALADDQAAARQVEIADLEINTLAGAQAGMSQDEETGIFQANERVGTVQASLDEGFQAAAIALGQIAGQPLWFGQRAEAEDGRIDGGPGLGLLAQGGQDIADNPVDGGGGDAVQSHPLALVSLQVSQSLS